MNERQLHILSLRQTDVRGAVERCCGSEELYFSCLKEFLNDTTVSELNESISDRAWDDAFTAAHSLKGLAGNLGFVPLMHTTSQLLIVIRGGRIKEIDEFLNEVNSAYRDIVDAIKQIVKVSNQKAGG